MQAILKIKEHLVDKLLPSHLWMFLGELFCQIMWNMH